MKVKQNIIAFILGMLVMLPVGAYGGSLIVKAVNTPVLVDGVQLKTPVYSINGSTSAPVKAVAEAMGGTVKASGGKVYVETPKTDLEKVAATAKDSCVMIYVYKDGKAVMRGSGFAYNGHVITAKHVTDAGDSYIVYTDDSIYGVVATKVTIETDLDVSVLTVPVKIPPVTLGDSDKLIEGQKLVAITSPNGFKNAIDECVYSGNGYGNNRFYVGISESEMEGGSSGGAVFDMKGLLIGMNVIGEGHENNSIPVNDLKPVIEKLK